MDSEWSWGHVVSWSGRFAAVAHASRPARSWRKSRFLVRRFEETHSGFDEEGKWSDSGGEGDGDEGDCYARVEFVEVDFDILFDLELEPNLPLKHVLNMSCAKMKVGAEQKDWPNRDYDVQIGRIEHTPNDDEEIVDPMIVWKEQIERTFKFISEANIQ